MELPEKIKNVVEVFSLLPGVGEKTALRQTLQVLKWDDAVLEKFSEGVKELSQIEYCSECGFFSEDVLCNICRDSERDSRVICVVEEVTDCMAIENSGSFRGLYHVLGGVLNPMLGVGPENLSLNRLFERVIEKQVSEVILALNPSVEGDATCAYIKEKLPNGVRADRIGFGIPIGGSLEYLDSMTITKALENKKHL